MTQVAVRPQSRLIPTAAVAGVLTAAAAGWLVLTERMAGMDSGPGGDPGALGWFAGTWAVMMAAMMLPASVPAVLRLARARRSKAPAAAVLFVAGYGAVWMLAGLVGYSLVQVMRGLRLGALAWSEAGSYVAGASVAAAGLYQLTNAKRRSLARCTAPDLTLPHHRITGALLTGAKHGGCCVACCWNLMAALYALGMMSTTWMAMLTILIASERLLPRPALAVHAVAAVLVMLGIAVAAAPAAVPALTTRSRVTPRLFPAQGSPTGGRELVDRRPTSPPRAWLAASSPSDRVVVTSRRWELPGSYHGRRLDRWTLAMRWDRLNSRS